MKKQSPFPRNDKSETPFFQPASDHSLLISFGNEISSESHRRVVQLSQQLLKHPSDFILNIQPAYSSILVAFDPLHISFEEVESSVRALLSETRNDPIPMPNRIEIPVCYDPSFAPDLQDVATLNGLSKEEVIEIHLSGNYEVAFIGFTPGFPYLAGMSSRIATPRLPTPRTRVPAGSVAIGGGQTGLYPMSTPGGWRIIGRTPLTLFMPERNPPSLLTLGDEVRFRRISRLEFDQFQSPSLSSSDEPKPGSSSC